MKKYLFLCITALSIIGTGCQKEAINPDQNVPTLNAAGNNRIPSYTMAEMDALLNEQQDEAAFVKKTEITAYVLTRWLGEHAGSIGLHPGGQVTGGGTLNGVLPCDMGWEGDGGILRVLGQASGLGEAGVAAQMSAYVEACVKGCTLPPAEVQNLVYTLLGSLIHDGQSYEQRTAYAQAAVGNQPRIFVSHGIGMTPQGLRALGFQYHLNSGALIYAEKTPAEALALGTLLLLPTETGPGAQRFVNPCGITWSNGGGGNGGSGGGNNLDDDGAEKHIVDGPIVKPDSIYQCPPNSREALRINRFHLADRNEGGLFSGQSEVYLSASIWLTGDMNSLRTNTEGNLQYLYINGQGCWVNDGKHLTSVSATNIGNNSVITYPANGENWTIIESGFCELFSYDNCKITLYEHDKLPDPRHSRKLWHEDWITTDSCKAQFCYMTFLNDAWFSNNSFSIRPSDFTPLNNFKVYLVEVVGGYQLWDYMPSGQYSWFELEAY